MSSFDVKGVFKDGDDRLGLVCTLACRDRCCNIRWYENQLYVLKSMIAYNGTKINQKKGSSIAQRKMGGWQNAWDQARIVAGWMPASRLHL